MKRKERKYDYANVERLAGVEYKYSMAAVAAYIAIHLGFIDIGGGSLWILATAGLAIFIWWSFRAYFVQVNDTKTANWLLAIIGMYALFGMASLLLVATTNVMEWIRTGKTIFYLLNVLMVILGLSVVAFMAVCIKVISINKHHSFPLKRIAISSLIFIPIYMTFFLIYNVQFIGEMGNLIWDTSLDSSKITYDILFGDLISGVISFVTFIGNLILMIPYYFLLFFFYKADQENSYFLEDLD